MWNFNGKELDPSKLPQRADVVEYIISHGSNISREALLSWDYSEFGCDVAYWHSWYPEFNPDKNVGSVLMPVLEGILRAKGQGDIIYESIQPRHAN